MPDSKLLCLCGSNINYIDCCQPYHNSEKSPETAEALLRSRFTGYVMQNVAYLLDTWDIGTRPHNIDFSNEDAIWTKLEIVNIKKGGKKHTKGIIEFKAYYTTNSEEYVLNEISRFKKSSSRWLYMDGIVKSTSLLGQQTEQGKNAPCSCGSGKKFKRCCGK